MGPGIRLAGAVFAAIFLVSCASRPKLPDVPAVNLGNFLPAVRAEVQKAYEAVEANPRDPDVNGRLGMVLQAHDLNEPAAVCYTRAHLLAPKSFDWAYYLGAAEAAQGKNEPAAEVLRKALKLDPSYVPARLKLAEALFSSGDLQGSGAEYEAVIRSSPDSAAAFYGLGRVQSSTGNARQATQSFERACELFPAYGAAHYALALEYRRGGETKKASEHIAAHEKHRADIPPENDRLMAAVRALNAGAVAYVRKGIALEAAGRLAEAAAEHENALRADPNHAQAHVNLISLYGRLGEPDKAEQHFRAAIGLNPSLAEAYYNYGVLLFRQEKGKEAEAAFRKAIEINPLYAEAHMNLGVALERVGKTAEALAHYRKAAENKPNYRLAHFHIGRVLVRQGSYREAIEHLSQTLKPEDENTPGYLYALASAYARAGNRSSATSYALQARQRAAVLGQARLVETIDRDLGSLQHAAAR